MPRTVIDTKFFEYDQNNSGGTFEVDDARGIGPRVWIEATDVEHANQRAERIGLYWDGVARGMDCSCCGDRWSKPWRDEGLEEPTLDYHGSAYVHHLDGRVEHITAASEAQD